MSITSRQRIREHTRELADRQNHLCIWCGFRVGVTADDCLQIVTLENSDNDPRIRRMAARAIFGTFEHMVPRRHGGPATLDNGGCACWWCNSWRGDEDTLIFAARVTALIAANRHPRQIYRATGRWINRFPKKVDQP